MLLSDNLKVNESVSTVLQGLPISVLRLGTKGLKMSKSHMLYLRSLVKSSYFGTSHLETHISS